MARAASAEAKAWRGFERQPRGCLIHQLIDLRSPMGIAYERSLDFFKRPHAHDRAILIFPRGGSAMEVTTTRDGRVHRVTASEGLVIPKGVEHDDRAVSFVYDTFALLPSDELLRRTLGNAEALEARPAVSSPVFARSPWLEMLLDEYFAERVLGNAHPSNRAAHVEALILLDVAQAIATPPPRGRTGLERVAGPSSIVGRALRFLEANLFSPVDLERLSRAVGASRSSLLRHFRAHTGSTPISYVRARRLEEARELLRRGEHNVSEVARLVGYATLAGFSEAYNARFGAAPSSERR